MLNVLFKDADFLAIDKPAGLVVHATIDRRRENLNDLVQIRFPNAILVHRLDAGTSGVVLFALNKDAARAAQTEFQKRSVAKTYLAICRGKVMSPEFAVKAYLKKKKLTKTNQIEQVFSGGDYSETRFEVLATDPQPDGTVVSLVACFPKTGRMHQIRVHLALQGAPIIGDTLYEGQKLPPEDRPFYLHAARLAWLGREVRSPLDAHFLRQIELSRLQSAALRLATI
jgi:tRNA pseudouridine32 synthase / 23S rRNA pseudouridine746 synthase